MKPHRTRFSAAHLLVKGRLFGILLATFAVWVPASASNGAYDGVSNAAYDGASHGASASHAADAAPNGAPKALPTSLPASLSAALPGEAIANPPAASTEAPRPAAWKPWDFFALCMDTHDEKKRNLSEQARLLAALDYAGAGHLWLDDLPERLRSLDGEKLKLFQIYFRVDVGPAAKEPFDARLPDVLPLLAGRGVQIAALLGGGAPSDEALDVRAVDLVRKIADLARPHGASVVLYPHAGDWLERAEDAVRVAKKVDRPNVGVMFNLCHFLKVSKEEDLDATLAAIGPKLAAVSLNGADSGADIRAGKGNMILPLGRGKFDVLRLLVKLRSLGFRGPVGLQCWGIPGDARTHLEESRKAWGEMMHALEDHPEGDKPGVPQPEGKASPSTAESR